MFEEFSTIHDLRAFENKIYNALYDYCNDRESFDEDAILSINPVSLEVKVDNRYFVPLDYETYELENLITCNEPDEDAVYELANKFIFI